LDKIFQIPYALRPMRGKTERYIRDLLEPLTEPEESYATATEDRVHQDEQAFAPPYVDPEEVQIAGVGTFKETDSRAQELNRPAHANQQMRL
jgi:hypothetical protein